MHIVMTMETKWRRHMIGQLFVQGPSDKVERSTECRANVIDSIPNKKLGHCLWQS